MSSETPAFRFKLKRKQCPIVIEGEDGVERHYVMKELTGSDRDEYTTRIQGKVKYENGKPAGFKDHKGIQGGLLASCLYNEKGKLVAVEEIDSWPAMVREELFKIAQKLSGLDQEGADEAGNSSQASGSSGSASPPT